MKDVGTITRVNPDKRVEALMKFRRRIADNNEVISDFLFHIIIIFWRWFYWNFKWQWKSFHQADDLIEPI